MTRMFVPALLLLTSLRAEAVQEPADKDKISETLHEARTLIDRNLPTQAIEMLKTLAPASDARVTGMLGVAYYHANDPVRAIDALAPVVDKLPADSIEKRESIQVLGLCYYLAGHYLESIPFLEQTRAWTPNNLELTYALGLAFVRVKQTVRARNTFAGMFGVPPDSAAAHLLTAQMMLRLEILDSAQTELEKALEKDPRLPQAHLMLAELAISLNRLEEGIADLQKELQFNPGNSMALYRLGEIYARQLKWNEAIAALQKSVWINPYFSAPYILLGKAYQNKNDPGAAEGMLRRALQYDPNNKTAHYILGRVLLQMGRTDEAKRELEAARHLQGDLDR